DIALHYWATAEVMNEGLAIISQLSGTIWNGNFKSYTSVLVLKYFNSSPIRKIRMVNPSTNYDEKFVQEIQSYINTVSFSKSDWGVRLDPLDANITRAVSFGLSEMPKKAECRLKLGICNMVASVAVGNVDQSLGEVSIANNIIVTRIVIIALILYGIALIIIPLAIAGMNNIERWIIYEPIRTPSWRACFKSIRFQQQLLSQDHAGIEHRDGHFSPFKRCCFIS
ncbi:401_t:CDS:2, partial [Dentiscutata erythropus]